MCPVRLYPVGRSRRCAVSVNGIISFPDQVVKQLKWTYSDEIAVSYIEQPLVLLFACTDGATAGFKLSYLNRTQKHKSGGKISCHRLANQVLRPRVALPLDDLLPIYAYGVPYQLALILQDIPWQSIPFSRAGYERLPADAIGTYRIVGGSGAVLRIGEGVIANRMREHLGNSPLVKAAKRLEWLALTKEDAVVMERVLLSRYGQRHKKLPPFNKIRA